MTPEEYMKIADEQGAIIEKAERAIQAAREKAERAKPPKNLVPAHASDIKAGAIIWHEHEDYGWYWHVVDQERHYGDPFKAYVADDGCRYGLNGAWVSKGK